MRKLLSLALITALLLPNFAQADEGMWLPLFLKRNMKDMKKRGLQLTAEQLYDVNNASLKDAIASLGGFCTGEIISSQGLMLTNHHCAYGKIQDHSKVGADYLTDGFWAKNHDEELPNPGLTASFLVRMEDVTKKVMEATKGKSGREKAQAIQKIYQELSAKATEGTHYDAYVRDFFEGNEHYLFVVEVFKDVRLVGAPPSSIGKYGGDTDNWMWPRHTGDFALFRVYAGKDGKPAEYSKDNVPMKPKHFLPVSTSGVKKGDFAMVMGYPGSTTRYKSSFGLNQAYEISNPARVKLREKRLALMKEDMNSSDEIRIKYAAKYAQISNYWKYFKGQNQGLERLGTVEEKRKMEAKFIKWAEKNDKKEYVDAYKQIEDAYKKLDSYALSQVYINEAAFAPEVFPLAFRMESLYELLQKPEENKERIDAFMADLKDAGEKHFKNFNLATDKKVFIALMNMYKEDIVEDQRPEIFAQINKEHGSLEKFADVLYSNSMLVDQAKFNEFLKHPTAQALESDPAVAFTFSVVNTYRYKVAIALYGPKGINNQLDAARQVFVKGLMEYNSKNLMYPDANSTIRLTYGRVRNYKSYDKKPYKHYTDMEGLMAKKNPNSDEFNVPEKLETIYKNKDYGSYKEDDYMPVCFITDNDITGGNSGSPVINGKGELIGLAFDGNWEAMTGDLVYDAKYKRCINVDIRYVLMIIDKFAGADHLIKEMKLVNN